MYNKIPGELIFLSLFLKSFLFFSGLNICSHTGVFKLSHLIFESSLGSKYVTTKSAVCIFGWLTGNIFETCAVVMGLMQFLRIRIRIGSKSLLEERSSFLK
jgi:hypothetical protein